MALQKVKGPDKQGREAIYYADKQDLAYQRGAYDYLHSIAMLPRMATIAGYVKALGLKKVLDIGCGTGDLLAHLAPDVTYIGADISSTAISTAKERFADRAHTAFHIVDFRQWQCPYTDLDGVVWAGIGCTWTHKGRNGSARDWLEILALGERPLREDGYLILELVTSHSSSLEQLIAGRYAYEAGCDLDCFQSEESPKRSIRVLKKNRLTFS